MGRKLAELLTVVGVGLVVLAASSGCQNDAAPGSSGGSATAKAAPPAASVAQTPAGSAGTAGAAGGADQAADQMFAMVEKLAALVDQSKAGGKVDCKKLGEALGKFLQENEAGLKKLREGGGGKSAVDSAMKKKYGEKVQGPIDKILEATDVDCNGEQSVRDASKKLDL
jgi:hypothetical protein